MSQEKSLQTADKSVSVKSLFTQDKVKSKFEEILGKKSAGFMASVLQIASLNLPKNIEPNSVLQAALMAATLDLPVNNNLGYVYLIGYNQKQPDGSYRPVGQLQIGWRGFVQLAQRSGLYETISATPIYEGQLKSMNPLTGYEFDFTKKDSENIIGFAGYFSLVNGFHKTLYMSMSEMQAHGLKYSKTYKTGLWQTDKVSMGCKTVLKMLLSKFGPMSIEMQRAVKSDQSIINDVDTEDVTYVDNVDYEDVVNPEEQRIRLLIDESKSREELLALLDSMDMNEEQTDYYKKKFDSLPETKKK